MIFPPPSEERKQVGRKHPHAREKMETQEPQKDEEGDIMQNQNRQAINNEHAKHPRTGKKTRWRYTMRSNQSAGGPAEARKNRRLEEMETWKRVHWAGLEAGPMRNNPA